MTRFRVQFALVFVALILALAAACGSDDTTSVTSSQPARAGNGAAAGTPSAYPLRGELTVFAASSLTDAFKEIGAAFQKANPAVTPKFNNAASTALRTQLEQGAKADLFASADQIQMESAKEAGVIEGEERLFAKNKLVIVYPTGNPGQIRAIEDLARPGIKLVLTDKNVPIGAYAHTALEQMSADPQFGTDFSRRVLANVKSEEANVRAVVTKVQLGEADAGIVYASDVTPAVAKEVQSIPIPDAYNTIAVYPIAVVKGAPNAVAARAFIAFLRSPDGQAILRQNNFIVDRDTEAGRALPATTPDRRAAYIDPPPLTARRGGRDAA